MCKGTGIKLWSSGCSSRFCVKYILLMSGWPWRRLNRLARFYVRIVVVHMVIFFFQCYKSLTLLLLSGVYDDLL